jgi:hypothetical protein
MRDLPELEQDLPELDGLLVGEIVTRSEEAAHLLLEAGHVLLHLLDGHLGGGGQPAHMQNTAPKGTHST